MDLVSMVVDNKEPVKSKSSLLNRNRYLEIESRVMGFHVFRNNWKPVIEEVLKTWMEPQNEVGKYAMAVVHNENNVIGHLPKEKNRKYAKAIFHFLKTDLLNIYHPKTTGKAVNVGDNKGMRIPCLRQFTGKYKIRNILQELIFKL